MGGVAIAPPTSLVEKDKELPQDFPYEEDSRPRSQSSKAAIPPPVYEEQDRPRSPTDPGNSFLANMGGTVALKSCRSTASGTARVSGSMSRV